MSSRTYEQFTAQQQRWVRLPFTMLFHGVADPENGEGDIKKTNYLLARADVGKYSITTVDKFVAVVKFSVDFQSHTGAVNDAAVIKSQTKNADGTFTFVVWFYVGGALADPDSGSPVDLSTGDCAYCEGVFRNSGVVS